MHRQVRFTQKSTCQSKCFFAGAANGIRTHDLVITNDVLYLLSYSSVPNAYCIITNACGFVKWGSEKK